MNALVEADRSGLWRLRIALPLITLGCLLAVAMYSSAGHKREKRSGSITVVTAGKDRTGSTNPTYGKSLASVPVDTRLAAEQSRRALIADLAARFPDLHEIEIVCASDCTLTAKVALLKARGISTSTLPLEGEIEKVSLAHKFAPNGRIMVEEYAAEEWTVRLPLRPTA